MRCWRASCGWFGLTLTDTNTKLQAYAMKPPSIYREPTELLSDGNYAYLNLNYQLDRDVMNKHGWRQNGSTLVMPVRSPYGEERGHVTRTFDKPKRCMTYKATAQPWLDWWPTHLDPRNPTVIVEDCLSACRLSGMGYNAVALLGTGISVEQAKEIASAGQQPIYLALDNDAFVKSLKLAKRHAHILHMAPVLLTEDIKVMEHDADIVRLFGGS